MTADHRSAYVSSVRDTLLALDHELRERRDTDVHSVPTGFPVLDETLGGGLRAGELVLLGGPPGVGKTIWALQWARNIARAGHRAVFACYEHEPAALLARLLALEAGEAGGGRQVARAINEALASTDGSRGLEELLAGCGAVGRDALRAVERYADDLILVRASGSRTDMASLQETIAPYVAPDRRTAVFVDYLQKVPVHPEPDTEHEKVTRTVAALKDLALDLHVPLVLLSAVDAEGLRARRLRMHHLRGSTAIAFESDVVLMLNDKERAVSKVHLSYDSVRAKGYRDYLVVSVEKNRGGAHMVDLEFRKDFRHFRLDPDGGLVAEQLVSEQLDEDRL